MGKAKDISKVTLRSMPSLRPAEHSKLVFDILKQHFSDVTCSSMPLADFYSKLPLAGESSMDYWICLNKAVDAADECLRRQGRNIEDPTLS
jgi:predicted nucleic-acid-binding Zn-ribbon protein